VIRASTDTSETCADDSWMPTDLVRGLKAYGSSPAKGGWWVEVGVLGDDVLVIVVSRRYFAAATFANGIFSVPGGSSGMNTAWSMRGMKSQSLKTAVNCGCEGWFL
jgi:hypothetical protein